MYNNNQYTLYIHYNSNNVSTIITIFEKNHCNVIYNWFMYSIIVIGNIILNIRKIIRNNAIKKFKKNN